MAEEQSNRLHKQLKFLAEMEKLKAVKRQNRTLDGYRFENSAEHSWHLAIMALVLKNLGDDGDLNWGRIIEMLLIHDLAEIDADDAFLYDEAARLAATEKEELGARRLYGLLPADQQAYFLAVRNEFEERKTAESQIALALDAFQPLLNHLHTAKENDNPHQLKKSQIIAKKLFIKEIMPALWPFVLEIIEASTAKGLYKDE